MPAFSAQSVVKRYKDTTALAGVSLHVEEGELVGLIGPNGAGKSTLTKIGCGLVRPTAGAVTVCGSPPGSLEARSALGYLAELFRFPPWLRTEEVLELHQRLVGTSRGRDERLRLLELVGLSVAAHRPVQALSKGMQQRLGIAQALIGEPRLLLLDEPTSALDPGGRRVVRAILEDVRERGIAVLLNSHLLGEVELVCDRVVIILAGQVIAEGSPEDLTRTRGVTVVTTTGTQEFPDIEQDDVPDLIARLVAEGERILSVSPTRTNLEDVYMRLVKGEMG
jgi:ABC-2 type transport system ATP-binding protein